MQIPILVINLDRSQDRLDSIARRLAGLGLEFLRIRAVDGATLPPEEKRQAYRSRYWRQTPTDGEIGVYLSHMKALRYAVENRFEKAIILEDDAHFSEEFAKIALGKRDIAFPFDVLKLEGVHVEGKTYVHKRGLPENILAIANTHGAAAYLVTLAGARRIIKRLPKMLYRYDDDLFCNWRNGLVIYDYYPFPVWQGGQPTTIPGRNAQRGTARQQKMLRLLRILPKNFDKLNKTLFHLRRFGLSGLRPRSLAALRAEARDLR